MKSTNNVLLRTLLVMITLTIPLFAQVGFNHHKVVYDQILSLIHGKYGQDYHFNYAIMDTVIRYSYEDNVQDPYGTLKGCILYSAYKYQADSVPNDFIVGMIKHGRIIWDNSPGSDANLSNDNHYGTLLFSQDLNNDGEVDLVFADYKRNFISDAQPTITYIRILSWNGARGRLISGNMIGSGSDELLDVNGDGVMELREKLVTEDEISSPEFKTSSFPYVTYGWNGSQYGLWPNVKQYAENEFLPANIFQAKVMCEVIKTGDSLVYSYSLVNQKASVQKIDNFYVANADNISSESAPNLWSAGVSSYFGSTVYWANYGNAGVENGKTLHGLKATSLALPTIVKYYLQGYTGGVTCCPTDAEETQNILTNSVTGFTLGTRDTSVSVGVLQWLDTLIYYTRQSATLGWLGQGRDNDNDSDEQADNGLTKNIEQRYQKAKQQLLRGDSVQARKELAKLVDKVERIWRGGRQDEEREKRDRGDIKMTSESYALLKYNTEYVTNLLPEKSPRRK